MTTTPTTAPSPLSGHQVHLALGDQRAVVADVGAKLRQYGVGGREVILAFDEDRPAPAGSGSVLAPWPNRLRDGRYTFEGAEYQVDISEPALHNALHGLVMWQRWVAVAVDDPAHAAGEAATLELRLPATNGYPFDLHLQATYRLTAAGLHVQVVATNLGGRTAPYGVGFHPWLSPGGASLDDCSIRLDAATHVTIDDRMLPTGTAPVAGGTDLRTTRSLRGLDLDDAFVDVLRDEDGLSWIRLTGADGRTAAVWMDGSMDAWQICTGDHIQPLEMRRAGVAAEPMSCIADAFRTGDRLVLLAPGASHTVTWGAALL